MRVAHKALIQSMASNFYRYGAILDKIGEYDNINKDDYYQELISLADEVTKSLDYLHYLASDAGQLKHKNGGKHA